MKDFFFRWQSQNEWLSLFCEQQKVRNRNQMTLFAEVTTVVKLENIGKNTKKSLKSKYPPNDLFFHFLLIFELSDSECG